VLLVFLFRFHRDTVSRCQSCVCASSALLKACESFKEKVFFCCRISAPRNENFLRKLRACFPFLNFLPRDSPFWFIPLDRGLTPHAPSSILERVEASHLTACYLRNGKDLSPSRLPLLQLLLLSLLHAAGVFLGRIASFES
jgi:hypothetical protein